MNIGELVDKLSALPRHLKVMALVEGYHTEVVQVGVFAQADTPQVLLVPYPGVQPVEEGVYAPKDFLP